MWYDVFGTINTIFIFVSVFGVYTQLRKVWDRKGVLETGKATELLSTNQFTVSFLAYFSFFVYGYSIEPFNHYIVWPRLIASIIAAAILFEIWWERRDWNSALSMVLLCFSFILGGSGLIFGSTLQDESRVISTVLILAITLLLAQGYYHQIMLIVRSGSTGAVELKMSQFILMMDVSTILFALSMGLHKGWPLMVLAVVSGATKLIIMYLFYWVRTSDAAKSRRMAEN